MKKIRQLRVIICGSRELSDIRYIIRCMNYLRQFVSFGKENITIITGGAKGVDTIANALAMKYGYNTEVYEADWEKDKKSAGVIRNQKMLDTGINIVLALFDATRTSGTGDMADRARAAGVETVEFYKEQIGDKV